MAESKAAAGANDLLPEPGDHLEPPRELESRTIEAWRLHWEADIRSPKRRNPGVYRFDAPKGEYSVTYASTAREGCIAECYGKTKRIASKQADRRLTMLTTDRPLRIVALDLAKVQKALGLDARIATAEQYATTQRWSRWLHDNTDADAIRYVSRQDDEKQNFCLFLDRCADALTLHPEGTLKALRREVLQMADRYDISVYLPRNHRHRPGR